jgi:hypothetical protein
VAGGVIGWFGTPSREAFGVISAFAVSLAVLALVVTGRARCAVDVMVRRA